MDELSDQQLLRDYAANHSEAAFAELVRRHVDLVYSAAMRLVCEPHSAEDVTQAVFVTLTRQAAALVAHPVLSGWLHCTARNLAANFIRSDVRRRAREQEAATMNELVNTESETPWEEIAPHLDAALGELTESERDVVMLRYFEKKSAPEMASILGVTHEAAQKRVSRAVDRLRTILARRGIPVGAGSLMAVLTANAVQAAPASLALQITSAALAGTAASTSTLITATKGIAMTALQKTTVAITVTVLAGAGIYEARQNARLREEKQALQQQHSPLTEQIQQLQAERNEMSNLLASAREENNRLNENQAELLRLRSMAGVARRSATEAEQLRAKVARLEKQSNEGGNPISTAMADAMKTAMEQQMEGKLTRMAATLKLTPDQVEAVRAILMRQAKAVSAGMQQAFTGKFDKEEIKRLSKDSGDVDTQIKALLTPEQVAGYPEHQKEEASHNASMAANTELVQMQTSLGLTAEQLDPVYAALYGCYVNQASQAAKQKFTDQEGAIQWALDQKVKSLESVLTPVQLEKFQQQQAMQAKLVKDLVKKMGGENTK